ncbi:hypothetical protein AAG570_003993, partial [Ranatra chinensis]
CEAVSASDYVEFSNFLAPDRKYTRHCGQLSPFHVESEKKFFRVTFRSNDRLDSTGFNATYQFVQMDEILTRPPQNTNSSKMLTCKHFCYLDNFRIEGIIVT